ncbi:MAG: GGDEF domain-containing protein, partial [Evtepia sp.]
QINDTRGYDYGDRVICAVADQLRLHFRKGDVIARMGGDEFVVFICNISEGDPMEKKVAQLCTDIANIEMDGECAKITCSVGLALSSETTNTFELLYHHADQALYSAKDRAVTEKQHFSNQEEI